MRSFLMTINLMVAGLIWLLVPAPAALAAPASTDNKPAGESPNDKARKALEQTVSVEYSGQTIQEVLADLSEKAKAQFVLDAAQEPWGNVVVNLKARDITIGSALRRLQLWCVVTEGAIMVTTEDGAIQ